MIFLPFVYTSMVHKGMEEMAKAQGLQRRGNGWYLRVRVPTDILQHYKGKEVIRTLRTNDHAVASRRIHSARAALEAEFEAKRKDAQTETEYGDVLSGYGEHELNALVLKWMRDVKTRNTVRRIKGAGDWTQERIIEHGIELRQEEFTARQEVLGMTGEEYHEGNTTASRFLEAEGISFRRDTDNFQKLGHFFSRAIHELAQESLREFLGKARATTSTPLADTGQASQFKPEAVVTLGALFDEYLSDPSRTKGASTQKNYKIIKRAVDEVVGLDTPVHLLKRQECKDIRNFLMRVPSNAVKKTKAKTLREAIKIGEKQGLPQMAPATLNMHLQKLNAILDYAVRENYTEKNQAKGLSVQDTVKAKHKRMPFDTEQLNKIFNAPIYTGCVDDSRNYNKAGSAKPRRSRFWVPLVSLFTGMRLNEICQLHTSDVGVLDGVNVIYIRYDGDAEDGDDEKRIKTDSGIRFVPVHPMLERIGFLQFVEECIKNNQKRLFPELKKSGRGDYSHEMTKWFGRFLENIGAKRPRTTFHSFRHLYRDAIREANLSLAAALQLGGWSRGTTDEDYGSGLRASTLYKEITKISYPDLNLSHLYQ